MTQPLAASRAAYRVLALVQSRESGTVRRDGSALPTTGYFVGGKVPTLVLRSADVDPDALLSWVDSHQRAEYIGVWLEHDTGLTHVDMTDWVVNESYALGLARRREELAIYDIRNARDIKVNEEQS